MVTRYGIPLGPLQVLLIKYGQEWRQAKMSGLARKRKTYARRTLDDQTERVRTFIDSVIDRSAEHHDWWSPHEYPL